MRIKQTWLVMLLAILVLFRAAPAQGAEEGWESRLELRIWGFDLAYSRQGAPLFSGVDTHYFFSAGGGYQTFGFYREADNKAYTPPQKGENLALYRNANLTWSAGLRQGVLYDLARRRNLVDLVLIFNGRYDHHFTEKNPGALLFASDLPDRDGGWQNSLLAGLVYDGVDVNRERCLKHGVYAEVSVETAPPFLGNGSTGADYTRLNGTVMGFLTLQEGREVSIYLADRVMYDYLTGNYIPVRARTTFGGYSKYPAATRGLGGGFRGVEEDRFDGYIKALNNLELRINFPRWSEYGVVPEVIFYFDAGLYDDLTRRLDFDRVMTSLGVGVGLSDLIVYGNYFLNEQQFSITLALGIHF
ncbi:MAG: hypothetical protein GX050_02310 [Firmicutes bacterium]|nr:hypothetical protein [Bacillota bacterium]